MYRRVAKTVLALFFGTGQEVLFQVLSAVVWIYAWGPDLYAEWLLVSLMPTLLMRGNTGLFHCASSQLITNFAAEDWIAARRSYDTLRHGQQFFLLLIAVIYTSACLVFAGGFNLNSLSSADIAAAMGLFLIQFALFQQQQILLSVTKAAGHAPLAVMWQNLFRAAFIAPMLCGAFFAGPLVCLGMAMACQAVVVATSWQRLGQFRRELPSEVIQPERHEVIALVQRGLGFSAFGFGQTLLHNAAVWALGFVAGPLAGAAFHNMRTIARSVVLMAVALEQATRLELSRLFAGGKADAAERLLSRMLVVTTTAAGITTLVVLLVGEWAFTIMTQNRLVFDAATFACLCGAGFVFAVAFVYLAVSFALNEHSRLSIRYACLVAFTIPLIVFAANNGAFALALAGAGADVVFLALARRQAQGVLRQRNEAAHVV
ncbi:MAG: hypothetical protein AAFM91_04930 [Pseudomonadota bacterium]